ncbi:MAG: integrase arm-type DNA-binding domain-containing protein [Gemmatimonadetes bacterium]|nr:integrase arm-type DNA-binding domain-containing protein [Gemmatimonadota bacterium]
MRKKLTAKGIDSLTTEKQREDFWDTVTPGLCLRVSGLTEGKTWFVRYRANGKHVRLKLGTANRMTLAEAREDARAALQRADAGEDPAQEKEDRRRGLYTFGKMAAEVLEARALRNRERTSQERARILERELLPTWRSRPVDSITRREVVHLVEAIARRGAPVLANRTLSLVRLIFNDGLRRGFPTLDSNPAHLVQPPGQEDGRDRWLEPAEIKAVWTATEEESPLIRGIFRLALLTVARIGSVSALRWDAVSGDLWTIPASNFKGRRPHLVPLLSEVLDIVTELREVATSDEWVFPARAGTKRPHLANTAGSLARIRERTAIPPWTAHDFRTTFRTHALRSREPNGSGEPAGLGIDARVADAVLGHKEASGGFAHYAGDKLNYLIHEKREALRRWGAFVRMAVEG